MLKYASYLTKGDPIPFSEIDALKSRLHVGDRITVPVLTFEASWAAGKYHNEKCVIEEMSTHVIMLRRKNGSRTSITYNELAVLARGKDEAG